METVIEPLVPDMAAIYRYMPHDDCPPLPLAPGIIQSRGFLFLLFRHLHEGYISLF